MSKRLVICTPERQKQKKQRNSYLELRYARQSTHEKEAHHEGVPCRRDDATLHTRDGCLVKGYKELEEAYTSRLQMVEETMSLVEQYRRIIKWTREACKEEKLKKENEKLKK